MRVGHALGAGRPDGVTGSTNMALQLSLMVGSAVAAIVLLIPSLIASTILGSASPEAFAAVLTLLPAVAAFLLLEIIMSAAGGALGGLRDAKGPLVIVILGAWLVGLPLGSFLASTVTMPALGLWSGLLIGAALTTLLLLLRLQVRIRTL